MNTETIKSKYPKTWKQLLVLVSKERIKIETPNSFLGYKLKPTITYEDAKPPTREFAGLVEKYVASIKEPIWTLCEKFLTEEYLSLIQGDKGEHTIIIAGVDFIHGFNRWSRNKLISPYIWETDEEDELLSLCAIEAILWETKGKIRHQLEYDLCGGENEDS